MPFDFPASPSNGQLFTPPGGGPTYVFNNPIWKVKADPDAGIPDAPSDGKQYGRQDAAWTAITASTGVGGLALGEWTFNALTTVPPASGEFRIDAASQFDITKLRISETTKAGKDVAPLLKLVMQQGGFLYLQDTTDAGKWRSLRIVGPMLDQGSYVEVPAVPFEGGAFLADLSTCTIAVIPNEAAKTFVAVEPTQYPIPGQFWWESDTGSLYIWYDDGNTSQWVEVGAVGPMGPAGVKGDKGDKGDPGTGFPDAPSDPWAYGRMGGAWVKVLPLDGGTVNDQIIIAGTNVSPELSLDRQSINDPAYITGYLNSTPRWNINLGDNTPETGADAGSNFTINAYADNGTLKTPSLLTIDRATLNSTFTGNLIVNKASPALMLNRTDASQAYIAGQVNGANRWIVRMASGAVESGGNTGSDFQISRYNDVGGGGALIDTPFQITRSTGLITLGVGQVKFPTTANPSADPNTLDDYREGAWVPVIKFGGNSVGVTYGIQSGRYFRVGGLVVARGQLTLTAKGTSTGVATIAGLPILVGNLWGLATFGYASPMLSIVGAPQGIATQGTDSFRVTGGAAANTLDLTDANFAANSNIVFQVIYEAQ